MFRITEVTEATGKIYPEEDFLEDYRSQNIAGLVSAMAFESMVGEEIMQLGDSGIFIQLRPTGHRGKKGLADLKEYTLKLVEIMKKSISSMSGKYADFYQHFMKDFDRNGLVMPSYGRIL